MLGVSWGVDRGLHVSIGLHGYRQPLTAVTAEDRASLEWKFRESLPLVGNGHVLRGPRRTIPSKVALKNAESCCLPVSKVRGRFLSKLQPSAPREFWGIASRSLSQSVVSKCCDGWRVIRKSSRTAGARREFRGLAASLASHQKFRDHLPPACKGSTPCLASTTSTAPVPAQSSAPNRLPSNLAF